MLRAFSCVSGSPLLRPLALVVLLFPVLVLVGVRAPVAQAADEAPASKSPSGTINPDLPATDAPEGSIWDFIEPGGSSETAAVRSATEELARERIEELASFAGLGAEPPLAYYIDPLSATDNDPLHLEKVNPREFDIPIVVNDAVKQWMGYFLGRGRKYYGRYLERSTHWLPMMYAQIDERGLPRDLVYLSMIESGFSPGASSYASAVGLWQFMSATGRQYGLRVDWWVDERRDPEKSTRAALDYLTYLNRMFAGDWFLSWASYNGGEGRVMNATRRLGTTDFWKIVQANTLHSETENYVPKLIAAAIIGKHPERYGFVGVRYQSAFTFDHVDVPASTSVDVMARCAGISEETFLDYNPALRRWALPPDPEVQTVRVPAGRAGAFKEAFAKVPPAERISFVRHVVRKGESLGTIAKKYGVSVDELVRINRMQSASRVSVGQELIVPAKPKSTEVEVAPPKPTSGGAVTPAADPKTAAKTAASSGGVVSTYVIRRGDTLAAIARAQGVSVDDLKAWNSITDENEIYAGQKLSLRKGAAPAPAAAAATTTATYTVRSGDTLSGVAAKYGVTVAQLQSWNNLSGTTITVGRELVVKGGKVASSTAASSTTTRTTTYTVRRGDSLGAIADRYNCTVAELKSWNGLKGSTIYPGQKLKIKE